MAIPEACGLWIEQRLKEEIEETGDTMKSVRSIARDVTDEVNRVFETNINVETIKSRALRIKNQGGSNEPEVPTAQNDEKNSGVQGGTKITPKEAAPMVEEKVAEGKSKRQARKEVAAKTGLKENSVKVAHQRAEKKKKKPEPYFNPVSIMKPGRGKAPGGYLPVSTPGQFLLDNAILPVSNNHRHGKFRDPV